MSTTRTSNSALTWSLPIAVLVTMASVVGLMVPAVYAQETANWTLQAKGQDIGNLIAVVVLLLSAREYRRGSTRAGLVWLGTVLYLIYAYVVYAMAVHFNGLFLVYVAVLGLCVYAVVYSIDGLRGHDIAFPDGGRRLAAWTLLGTGVLFAVLWLSELIPALVFGQVPGSLVEAGLWVNPIHVIDLAMVLPAFIIAGALAPRGRRSGLFWLAPWLAFSVLMGTSIVAAMLLIATAGFDGTLPPTVMVSVVVILSAVALVRYLAGAEEAVTSA
ncbi:hypothetical protein [Tessaracoccus sp. MC1756]|uniref:hypothetical protein n=1 Tax=Tessaracoccus sp. MC1756 TaxID=2760311 RepID=UPI0015FEE148|nr:hypothetical protein [Tessaracoccus sp. MC1756]MBB1508303.1 hypothetical protein [Tessaracoccus sp. MC1756]